MKGVGKNHFVGEDFTVKSFQLEHKKSLSRKIIVGTIFRKILDAGLLFVVVGFCRLLSYDLHSWFGKISYLHMFLFFLGASLIVGLVQIIVKIKFGEHELYEPYEPTSTTIKILLWILRLLAPFLTIGIGSNILAYVEYSYAESAKYIVVISSFLLMQVLLMGRKSLLGIILWGIFCVIKKILSAIISLFFTIEDAIIAFCDLIGIHLFTALVEIVLTIGSTAAVSYIIKLYRIPSVEEYSKMNQIQLVELLNDLNINSNDGFFKIISEIQVSGEVYIMLLSMLFGLMIAGILCFLLGVGLIGTLSRNLLGWENRMSDKWDEVVPNRFDRNIMDYTNDNPFPIIVILSFILLLMLNSMLGFLMPLYITVNIIVGTIKLIKRLLQHSKI